MTLTLRFGKPPARAIPIQLVTPGGWKAWLKQQQAAHRQWIGDNMPEAKPGSTCLLPDAKGNISAVVAVIEGESPWAIAHLPARLPEGSYYIREDGNRFSQETLALGWALACYEFSLYRKQQKRFPLLYLPAALEKTSLPHIVESIFLARDLINTPTNDMLPSHLAEVAKKLARECGARCTQIVGDELLKKNFPAIHAVGRASADAPRLIDIGWGNEKHPKLTLVGKGVCFDSGGLDIKTAAGMKLMKKDMAGGAILLALARVIIKMKLPVRLRVLVPTVENAISGNAFRPLDIIKTRKGISVEIGNTDAEGRIILCDALAEADSEKPDLIIDCATLTGAARTALGTDLPAFFTDHEAWAERLARSAEETEDYVWRLPLWHAYRKKLDTPVADIISSDESPYAGAITAALFLNEFVSRSTPWLHLDMMAWNLDSKPGRPTGGEAMALRALYRMIENHFGSKRSAKPKRKRR